MEKPWFVLYFPWLRGRERGRQRENKKVGADGRKKASRQDTELFTPKSQSLALLLGRDACPLRVGGSRGGASTWVRVLIEVSTQAGRTSSQIIVVLVNSLRWFCLAFKPPCTVCEGLGRPIDDFSLPPREISSASFWSGGGGEELKHNVEGGCKCL